MKIHLLQLFSFFQNVFSLIKYMWFLFMANFGRKPEGTKIDKKDSYKTFITIALAINVVAWSFYRASLSAQFTTQVTNFPFKDLNSLSKTEYR